MISADSNMRFTLLSLSYFVRSNNACVSDRQDRTPIHVGSLLRGSIAVVVMARMVLVKRYIVRPYRPISSCHEITIGICPNMFLERLVSTIKRT
jgi:hypothetical protein